MGAEGGRSPQRRASRAERTGGKPSGSREEVGDLSSADASWRELASRGDPQAAARCATRAASAGDSEAGYRLEGDLGDPEAAQHAALSAARRGEFTDALYESTERLAAAGELYAYSRLGHTLMEVGRADEAKVISPRPPRTVTATAASL